MFIDISRVILTPHNELRTQRYKVRYKAQCKVHKGVVHKGVQTTDRPADSPTDNFTDATDGLSVSLYASCGINKKLFCVTVPKPLCCFCKLLYLLLHWCCSYCCMSMLLSLMLSGISDSGHSTHYWYWQGSEMSVSLFEQSG